MKQTNTHIKYGFITGLIMVIVSVLLYVTDLAFKPGMSYLSFVPFLIGILMNAVAFSKANDHYVSFGNVFSSCFKACAIVTLVSLVWGFLSFMIFPDMQDKAIEMATQQMEKKSLSQDQIDTAVDMTRKYFKVFMISGIVFGTMIWGAIFSLIGAAIAKKNKNSMPQVQQ